MSDQQAKDRELCSVLWYMFRDFGNIRNGQDESWEKVVRMANDAGTKYPEARRLVTEVLNILEDRAKAAAR